MEFNGGWSYPGVEYIWRRIFAEITVDLDKSNSRMSHNLIHCSLYKSLHTYMYLKLSVSTHTYIQYIHIHTCTYIHIHVHIMYIHIPIVLCVILPTVFCRNRTENCVCHIRLLSYA